MDGARRYRGDEMNQAHHQTTKTLGMALALVLLTIFLTTASQAQLEAIHKDLARRVVLVSITDRKLAVVENGTVLATFPVAVGATVSPSPTGEFQIVSRVANPTYYHAGAVIPSGKDSPIGTRWLGLSQKGYGIHGTNAPRSVGHAASHGCIRLRNRDMEQLYSMLHIGDVVQIRAERDAQLAHIFGGAKNEDTVAAAHLAELPAGQ
jgi:lipoprotein-anchoring transpeptidase ErfK/SrfK